MTQSKQYFENWNYSMFLVDVDEFLLKCGHFPNQTLYSPESTCFRLRPIACATVGGFLCWCVMIPFHKRFN